MGFEAAANLSEASEMRPEMVLNKGRHCVASLLGVFPSRNVGILGTDGSTV